MKKMKAIASLPLLVILAVVIVSIQPRSPIPAFRQARTEIGRGRLAATFARLPLSFEANEGQTDPRVKFLARGKGYTLFLTADEAVLNLQRSAGKPLDWFRRVQGKVAPDIQKPADPQPAAAVLRMKLVGSNPGVLVTGSDGLAARSNYLLGNNPAGWLTDVPHYATVHYKEIYPGIDLVFYGSQGEMEFDFEVAPGADPAAIQIAFEGEEKLTADPGGNLVIDTGHGTRLQLRKPRVYQQTREGKREIAGSYTLQSEHQAGFALGAYDHSAPVILDPVLSYSTYLGGAVEDSGHAIAVDASGSAYIAGESSSANFPVATPLQGALAGSSDVFVAKLNPAGSALVYSTFLGGAQPDSAYGIAVDASGTAYITGATASANFPVVSPVQASYGGGLSDAFVARLNASGSALIFSTYLGGNGSITGDAGYAIALDPSGNAYVTGVTDSPTFPLTSNGFQTALSFVDAFVTKLNPTGTSLQYSTFFGGGGGVIVGNGIAVDSSGSAYITGSTAFAALPLMNPFQSIAGGGTCGTAQNNFPCPDAFATKFTAAGSALVYSTYLGGNGDDEGFAIAVDSSGNVLVTGVTGSSNYPTANALQATKGAGFDAFVTKLAPTGSTLLYSTFMGGGGRDAGFGIAVGSSGNAYVAGQTGSNVFPVAGAFQPVQGGNFDAFASSLSPTGALLFSSYIGGVAWESTYGVAIDGSENMYVIGETESTNFPTVNPIQSTYSGGVCGTAPNTFPCDDGFVVKISGFDNPVPSLTSLSPASASTGGVAFALTVNGSGFVPTSLVRWNGSNRTTTFVSATRLTAAILAADIAADGTAQVTVFNPAPGGGTSNALSLTISTGVGPNPVPTLSALSPASAQAGGAAFALAVNGSNFVSTSVLRWNGGDRPTTFVSATQITALISSSDIAAAGTAQVTIFNPAPGGGTSAPLPFSITPAGAVPIFTAAGMVNAASFTGAPPAAGSIATLFGTNFATAEFFAATLPLLTTLGGTTVRLNNIAAPLFYVGPGQINFAIPWELIGQSTATMTVTNSVGTSASVAVNLSLAAPGIFATNQQGTGQGAILISNTPTFAAPVGSIPGSSARPANRNEFITIFCTGLGDVANRPANGVAAGGSSRTTATPTVLIGGVPASVSFSGLAPGFVGLYQIDVPVPGNAPTGSTVLVGVSIGGITANTVAIAVQ